ncbi:MAG TPA: glycosyltransferase family 4 protein [Candidatus Methanoperedens sp.]|nr:glycosyltransferase family 4 protein [Candidatus Methanoperedens sp.]
MDTDEANLTPMKRVLFIEQNTDGTVGGSHHSLLYLVRGLDRNRYTPTVVFYQEHRLVGDFEAAGCKVIILRKPVPFDPTRCFPWLQPGRSSPKLGTIFSLPLVAGCKAANYFRTFLLPILECRRILRREMIDLVHMNNSLLRPQQWIAAALSAGISVVAHERGINNGFPRLMRFWAGHLKGIVCISRAVRDNLARHGFPASKLVLIYNGLDPEQFQSTRSREEVLRELGIGPEEPVIGIVGNIKGWKGQETVIEATQFVRARYGTVRCLVVGGASREDEGYLEKLKKMVADRGLKEHVIFTGARSDAPNLVNCMTVLIHASILPEPFGRVLLEGMALGKPVITTAIGAGPEIVVDNTTGLIVPPRDSRALADAVASLLGDPARAAEMGRAGRLRLENCFAISENIRRTQELYRRVLQES